MFKLFEKYPNLVVELSEREDGNMKIISGHSDILENVRMFLEKNGIKQDDCFRAVLCHGKNVEKIAAKDMDRSFENTDALFTKEKNVFLSVTVADCLPIFLFDPQKQIVGIVHAGWRGLENGIIGETISKMVSGGSQPEKILAGIGPGIGPCHFEVGEDVAGKFSRFGGQVRREAGGKIFLDLKRIAELALLANGILSENIETNPSCTFCEKEKYFSFRRDGCGDVGKLEAMMAVIGIKK